MILMSSIEFQKGAFFYLVIKLLSCLGFGISLPVHIILWLYPNIGNELIGASEALLLFLFIAVVVLMYMREFKRPGDRDPFYTFGVYQLEIFINMITIRKFRGRLTLLGLLYVYIIFLIIVSLILYLLFKLELISNFTINNLNIFTAFLILGFYHGLIYTSVVGPYLDLN
jgi:hypothetical protein